MGVKPVATLNPGYRFHREGYLITTDNQVYEIATPYIFSQENWNENVRESNPPFSNTNITTHEDQYTVIRHPGHRRPNINIDDGWNLDSWEPRFAIWDSRWEGEWTDWIDFLHDFPHHVEIEDVSGNIVITNHELIRDDDDPFYSIQFLLTLWGARQSPHHTKPNQYVMDDIMQGYLNWLASGSETPDIYHWQGVVAGQNWITDPDDGVKYIPKETLRLKTIIPQKVNLPIINYGAPMSTQGRLIFRKFPEIAHIWQGAYSDRDARSKIKLPKNEIMTTLLDMDIYGNIFVEVPYLSQEDVAESGVGTTKLLQMQQEINQFRDLIMDFGTTTAYLLNFPFGIATPIV